MLSKFDLSQLPYISLSQLAQLPTCTGIYFAIDSAERVLYVGKTDNLLKRWKNHHRWHQLDEIHQKTPVRIAWLIWNQEDLASAEIYFINRYNPLFNGTKIETPQTIPSETILIELLEQIKPLIVVIGIKNASQNNLPTVYLNYNYENSGKNGFAQTIKRFIKNNKDRATNLKIKRMKFGLHPEWTSNVLRPGSREHKRVSRLQSSYNNHWEIACNGVIIDITPTYEEEFKFLRSRENSQLIQLAGVKVRSVKTNGIYPSLEPLIDDPIPLLWNAQC